MCPLWQFMKEMMKHSLLPMLWVKPYFLFLYGWTKDHEVSRSLQQISAKCIMIINQLLSQMILSTTMLWFCQVNSSIWDVTSCNNAVLAKLYRRAFLFPATMRSPPCPASVRNPPPCTKPQKRVGFLAFHEVWNNIFLSPIPSWPMKSSGLP